MYDIAIIGAGPGGYVAAIRAAQLGAKVALIEKDGVGGVCLNRGCLPSKTIIALAEKYNEAKKLSKYGINVENLTFDYSKISDKKRNVVDKLNKSLARLLKNKNVDVKIGEAVVESLGTLRVGEEIIEFKNLILATGTRTQSLPNLEIDHKFILDSDDILKLTELPESVLIVGSGAVGIEWSRIFHSFDKRVSIVEIADSLCPMHDREVSEHVEKLKKRSRIPVYKSTTIEKIENKKVLLSNEIEIEPDIVFLAAGRQPNTDIPGIEKFNIEKNGKYFKVDENFRTNVANVYAIGDVNGIFQLAHVAMHQGIAAVEHIMQGKETKLNYNQVPCIIYGKPEIACVGQTEDDLIKNNISFKKSIFPVSALGRAHAEDKIDGFIKVLANENEILGVHIVADCAGELIQQAVIAMSGGVSPEALTGFVFPHMTYTEAIHEAVLGVSEKSLHI